MNSNKYFNIEKINEDIIFIPYEGFDTLLIWLPGFGQTANDFFNDFDKDEINIPVPRKTKVIILTAPVSTNINTKYKLNAWFDYKDRSSNKKIIFEDTLIPHRERIINIINNEVSYFKGDYSKIFLGGFSQGAAMSLVIGLYINKLIGGIICCSGFYLPLIRPLEIHKKLPIFISHGDKDKVTTLLYAKQTFSILFNGDYNLTYKEYNINHEVNSEIYNDIKKFMELNKNRLEINPKF